MNRPCERHTVEWCPECQKTRPAGDYVELLQRFQKGEPGANEVLRDWLLERGTPEHATLDFLNAVSLGAAPESTKAASSGPPGTLVLQHFVRPFVLFDTEPFSAGLQFFRHIVDKDVALTNLTQPKRIRPYSMLHLRRISASKGTPSGPLPGMLVVTLNRREVLEYPLQALIERGPFGLPVREDIRDSDDINARLWDDQNLDLQTPPLVRINFHGWLREPLGS